MNKYKGYINVMGYEIPIVLPKSFLTIYSVYEDSVNGNIKTSGVGSIIRQVLNYLKDKGEISFDKLWIRTETYSGGNSVKAYTTGSDENSFIKMESIVSLFEYGSFNPMEDLYELKNNRLNIRFDVGIKNNDGGDYIEFECGSKYNFISNKPPFDVEEKMKEVV